MRGTVTPGQVPAVAEVTERLCRLIGEVADNVFHNSEPTDCICGRGGFWPLQSPAYWQHNPESAIAFIERATRAAIAEFAESKPDPFTWEPK